MQIIEYNSSSDIIVEFLDDYRYKKRTTYGNFSNGKIENRGAPTLFGIGILGTRPTWDKNKKRRSDPFVQWNEMLRRCYGNEDRFRSYHDVTVVKEWFVYDNFYDWYQQQENHNIECLTLDKDIIKKHQRIYGPDTCCLVPNRINCLFNKQKYQRGGSFIGTGYDSKYNVYRARCRGYNSEYISLGTYNTQEEAFNAYKEYKENLIKKIAKEEYEKGTITYRCYVAMMNYIVEEDD